MHLKRKKARPVRAGVVGVGQMGRYHVGVLAELAQVELVGIVDVDPQRIQHLADTYNTTALTDYHDLLGEVDVVSIAVPTTVHYEVAREFLDAGVHVLIEKPIAPTLAEAEELFELAERRGVMLHVGHVERFNGAVQELKNIVREPILIECRRLGPFQSRVKEDGVVLSREEARTTATRLVLLYERLAQPTPSELAAMRLANSQLDGTVSKVETSSKNP